MSAGAAMSDDPLEEWYDNEPMTPLDWFIILGLLAGIFLAGCVTGWNMR